MELLRSLALREGAHRVRNRHDATVTIMPGYAWGPTTIGQPMCGVDLHIVCKEKPQYMRRYAMFPSGQFAHPSFQLGSGKLPCSSRSSSLTASSARPTGYRGGRVVLTE